MRVSQIMEALSYGSKEGILSFCHPGYISLSNVQPLVICDVLPLTLAGTCIVNPCRPAATSAINRTEGCMHAQRGLCVFISCNASSFFLFIFFKAWLNVCSNNSLLMCAGLWRSTITNQHTNNLDLAVFSVEAHSLYSRLKKKKCNRIRRNEYELVSLKKKKTHHDLCKWKKKKKTFSGNDVNGVGFGTCINNRKRFTVLASMWVALY